MSVSLAGDVDGDGKDDLLFSGGQLEVARGRGDGSFDPASHFTTLWTIQMKAGDLNGDGRPDVALASWAPGAGQLILFMNASH